MHSYEATIVTIVGILLALIISAIAVWIMRGMRFGSAGKVLGGVGSFAVLCLYVLCILLVLLLLTPVALFAPLSGLLGLGILAFVLIEGARKYQGTQQYGLLWLLTVSAERFMPLAPAIEAFADERGGRHSNRAKRLVRLLNSGVSLPDGLDFCPGLLPPYSVPMIRVGHETGTLAQALRQAATIYNQHEPIWVAINAKMLYLFYAPVFGFMVLMFIMLKIVPSFEKIFKDFGTALPPMTQLLIGVASVTCNYWFFLLPFFLLGPLLLFYAPIRYFGWTTFDLPGMGRFTRRLDSAQVLDTLALVAQQQRPLNEGIVAMAQSYPKSHIRRRLREAAVDISAGRDWCESLLWHGLIRRPELAILHSAQRVGNLPWALHEMADSVRRRLAYRMQAMAQLLFPPVVILMGLVVMFIVVALFLPLISLIQHLV
jgi:type II secretory pathway component PulF